MSQIPLARLGGSFADMLVLVVDENAELCAAIVEYSRDCGHEVHGAQMVNAGWRSPLKTLLRSKWW